MKKDIRWLLPALTCVVVSVASLLLPILTYLYPNGRSISFNVLSFVKPSHELTSILDKYSGPYGMDISESLQTVLAALAVIAILAAFAGVITMSRQRPNTWQFILALVGIIGTAIPALLVIVAAPISQRYLPGTFRFGVYPIITPIAMIVCLIMVVQRRRKTLKEKRAVERAGGLIYRAGDL